MRCLQVLNALIMLALFSGSEVTRASDIPGEFEPPPCNFGPDGSLLNGVAACTGPMHISLSSGSGSLAANTTPFGAFDSPWVLTEQLSSDAAVQFSDGFGPALPFST